MQHNVLGGKLIIGLYLYYIELFADGQVKALTYQIYICHFLARGTALLG